LIIRALRGDAHLFGDAVAKKGEVNWFESAPHTILRMQSITWGSAASTLGARWSRKAKDSAGTETTSVREWKAASE
jgi:hypothetical protein